MNCIHVQVIPRLVNVSATPRGFIFNENELASDFPSAQDCRAAQKDSVPEFTVNGGLHDCSAIRPYWVRVQTAQVQICKSHTLA